MVATVTPLLPPKPKQTAVRGASLLEGRPTDPLVLAFEGDLEGLIALKEDQRILRLGFAHLKKYRALRYQAMLKVLNGTAASGDFRKLQMLENSIDLLVTFLEERAIRLDAVIIPELQALTTQVDHELTERKRWA